MNKKESKKVGKSQSMSYPASALLRLPNTTAAAGSGRLVSNTSPSSTTPLVGSHPGQRFPMVSQARDLTSAIMSHTLANSSTWTPSAVASSSGTDGEETPISRTMRYKKVLFVPIYCTGVRRAVSSREQFHTLSKMF